MILVILQLFAGFVEVVFRGGSFVDANTDISESVSTERPHQPPGIAIEISVFHTSSPCPPPRLRGRGVSGLGQHHLADLLQRVSIEGVAIAEVLDHDMDLLLVVVLVLIDMNVTLGIETPDLTGNTEDTLPLC